MQWYARRGAGTTAVRVPRAAARGGVVVEGDQFLVDAPDRRGRRLRRPAIADHGDEQDLEGGAGALHGLRRDVGTSTAPAPGAGCSRPGRRQRCPGVGGVDIGGRGATSSGRTVLPGRGSGSLGYSRPHAAGARPPAFAMADPACLRRAREQPRESATAAEAGRSSGERERPFPRCADGTYLRPCDAAVRSGPLRHHTTMEGTTHQ